MEKNPIADIMNGCCRRGGSILRIIRPELSKMGPCTWHIIALTVFGRQEEKLLPLTMRGGNRKGR